MPPSPYTLEFAPGYPLHHALNTDLIGRGIAFTGFYELRLSKEIAGRAKVGGLLVDVGANIGYFTHLWLAGNPQNRVIAFEASPRVFPILCRNVEAHASWLDRVHLHECAASDGEGEVCFDVGPAEQMGWGGMVCDGSGEGMVTVKSMRLDQVIPLDAEIAFLKIDVEGADPLVLLGAEGLLRAKRIREGCFEINEERLKRLNLRADEAIRLLRDCGYTVCLMPGECSFRLKK